MNKPEPKIIVDAADAAEQVTSSKTRRYARSLAIGATMLVASAAALTIAPSHAEAHGGHGIGGFFLGYAAGVFSRPVMLIPSNYTPAAATTRTSPWDNSQATVANNAKQVAQGTSPDATTVHTPPATLVTDLQATVAKRDGTIQTLTEGLDKAKDQLAKDAADLKTANDQITILNKKIADSTQANQNDHTWLYYLLGGSLIGLTIGLLAGNRGWGRNAFAPRPRDDGLGAGGGLARDAVREPVLGEDNVRVLPARGAAAAAAAVAGRNFRLQDGIPPDEQITTFADYFRGQGYDVSDPAEDGSVRARRIPPYNQNEASAYLLATREGIEVQGDGRDRDLGIREILKFYAASYGGYVPLNAAVSDAFKDAVRRISAELQDELRQQNPDFEFHIHEAPPRPAQNRRVEPQIPRAAA